MKTMVKTIDYLIKEVDNIVESKNSLLHQVGYYGSRETCKDEEISKACMETIFKFLNEKDLIKGYHLELTQYGGVPMEIFHKKFNLELPEWITRHRIHPNVPTLYLVSNDNPNEKHILCSGDDKYRSTGGNAIERVAKNYNFFLNYLTYGSQINPYVIFVCGDSFLDEKNEPKPYFWAKLLQTFKFTKEGKPNIFWSFNSEHSSDKDNWNQVYVQKERFTSSQKLEILLNVINESIEYYKTIL